MEDARDALPVVVLGCHICGTRPCPVLWMNTDRAEAVPDLTEYLNQHGFFFNFEDVGKDLPRRWTRFGAIGWMSVGSGSRQMPPAIEVDDVTPS